MYFKFIYRKSQVDNDFGFAFTVGFEPNATMNTAHHMLLYGCGEPGADNPVWYVYFVFIIFAIHSFYEEKKM